MLNIWYYGGNVEVLTDAQQYPNRDRIIEDSLNLMV